MKKNKVLFILGSLGLYLLSTGVSYAAFNFLRTSPKLEIESPLSEGGMEINLNAPKTEICPINGLKYTKQEKEIWEKRRPLSVVIENHMDCRPQSGLSKADIVYEVVAEGGITRFLAIYYCGAAAFDTLLGPIRSARTYLLDWTMEYDASFVHVGGAACYADVDPRVRALCQINEYGIRDIDQMGRYGSYPYFWRDYEKLGHSVATEHTMHSTTGKLWEVAEKAGYGPENEEGVYWLDNFKSWTFKDDDKEKGDVSSIEFDFWDGHQDYKVAWQYDEEKNEYKRINGENEHLDFNTKEQLRAKVVIVQKTKETGPVDEHKHLLYQTTGSGELLLFQDGKVIEGEWIKEKKASRTVFNDSRGREIEINRGKIWIEIVPSRNKIEY
ncbi:DUF3048 domain-containing protein [Candidatus Microgenomates bacterium]|nr:DUF3048 domain-containing protein [Candidatus Microgenomates bacterium]